MPFKIYTYEDPYKLDKADFWSEISALPHFCGARTLVNGLKDVLDDNIKGDMYPQFWTPRIGGIFMKYSYEYKKKCVELYRQGKWPETPAGVSTSGFHHAVVEWTRPEKACGTEVLWHKTQNKVWTAEEKYELVAKVFCRSIGTGNSNFSRNVFRSLVSMGQML